MICFTSVGTVETVTSTVAWEWHYNWRAKTKNRQKTTHCVDIKMVKILFYIYFDVGQLLWSSLWGYHWHVSYCKYEGGASFLLYDCVSTFYLQPFYSSRKKYKKQKQKNHRHIKMKSANWEWQDEWNRITHSGERKLCTMTSMYGFTACVCLISSWCVHLYSIFLTLCMFSWTLGLDPPITTKHIWS